MQELDKISIQFLLDFIEYSVIYNNEKISNIFELAKINFLKEIQLLYMM